MIINGKKIALHIHEELKKQIDDLGTKRPPCLAYILVGQHPASQLYVKRKAMMCEKIGIRVKGHCFENTVQQKQLLELVNALNLDPTVDGILIQMPLPPHLQTEHIIESLDPQKDVDGFHPFNMGRLLCGYTPYFIPCTPLGIHQMLLRSHIQIAHKHVVIMGRSNLVGKPLAALLMQKDNQANATVTIVHSHTENIADITSKADILIAAMGAPHFVGAHMVKKDAVIIDVGINHLHGKLVGDVDFESVVPYASHISPVPGGVGPMTIAMLLSNTFRSYQMRAALA